MNPQPVTLCGRLVRLEPLTLAHAPSLFQTLAIDPAVWRWWREIPPTDVAGMATFLQGLLNEQTAGSVIAFAQVEVASDRPVGGTTYMNVSRRDRGLEIGNSWLGKPWQRTGINTEAKYLLLCHAFEELAAVRVQLKTDSRNVQSQTAIARLGAIREGVLRKHMLARDGHFRDTVMFSITDTEWPGVKTRLEHLLASHSR